MGTPPSIAGTTTGSVTVDSGLLVTGDLNDVSGNAWADTWSIQTGATYGTASINPSTGLWTYNLDDTNAVVQALGPDDTLIDTFTVRVSDLAGADTQVITITIQGAPCFVAGTLIATATGARAVEDIAPGDLVWTRDSGLQPVRWVGSRRVSLAEQRSAVTLCPVVVRKGALGPGGPARDLRLSRQHRVLLAGPRVQALCGVPEVLLPVLRLMGLPGVELEVPQAAVSYHHLLFDRHQVVLAEGLPSESLLMGEETRQSLTEAALAEIAAIFPKPGARARLAQPARPIPEPALQRALVDRADVGALFTFEQDNGVPAGGQNRSSRRLR
jgi:VCBS repeat-containing protein